MSRLASAAGINIFPNDDGSWRPRGRKQSLEGTSRQSGSNPSTWSAAGSAAAMEMPMPAGYPAAHAA